MRKTPLPLRLLLLVAVVEVVAWTVATVPFQGPDEAPHYAYVQYLAETGHKPSFDGGGGMVSQETDGLFSGFNLYVLKRQPDARPYWSRSEVRYWDAYARTLTPAARKTGSGPNSVAKNPPLYYAYEAIPYRLAVAAGAGPFARLFWMRLANALLYLATIVLTWLIASELLASVLLRTLATATVVLLPMASFIGAVVNPDSMLAAIWAGALLASLRLLLRGFSTARVVGLLALCAASLLTHGRGLPLALFALVALGFAWHRHRPPLRRAGVAVGAGLALIVVGFVAYSLFLGGSGGGIYGGELRFAQHFSVTQFASFVWQFYLPRLPFMAVRPGPDFGFAQFFVQGFLPGAFGGQEVRFSDSTYRLMQVLCVAGVVAFAAAAYRQRVRIAERWDVAVLLAALALLTLAFLHLASYRAVVQPGATDALIVGRYLLPLAPLLGIAVAVVVAALRLSRQAYAVAGVFALGVLLQLGGLGLSVARFYG